MNLKRALLTVGFALLLIPAHPLRAQGGCVDSPEDPTVILALVAGTGILIARVRMSRNRKQ
jgi:XrtJ-associated TM-motif-TM protein